METNIKVDDRVLFSSQIGYNGGSPGNPTNPVEVSINKSSEFTLCSDIG